MKLFVCGYPGAVGGRKTELWHTLRLWRAIGIHTALIPMWTADRRIRCRCDRLGVETFVVRGPRELATIPFLQGGAVISFGEPEFLRHAHVFQELGCKTVWANPSTSISRAELQHREHFDAFDSYVFSSEKHFAQLWPRLAKLGVNLGQCFVIPAAFNADDFPFRPKRRLRTKPFVVGQITPPDPDRWSSGLWKMIRSIKYRNVQARAMGWTPSIERKLGSPPPSAKVFQPNAMSVGHFLRSLHCLVAVEAKPAASPRVGLEAMASGVPIIAANRDGWRELIKHGETGFLANTLSDFALYAELLARDEQLRLGIARRANEYVVRLCSAEVIGDKWRMMLAAVNTGVQPVLAS